jgi:hypothetical protein
MIQPHEKLEIIRLMLDEKLGQREINHRTGISRPTIRKIAKELGYQFPRNGVEVKGVLLVCVQCGKEYHRAPSRTVHTKYCSDACKNERQKGMYHPQWKGGKSVNTFSKWVSKQSAYKKWRAAVLERDGNKCVLTGATEKLEAHHLKPKLWESNPELVFDVSNGVTLHKDVHKFITVCIQRGEEPDVAWEKAKEQFGKQDLNKTTVWF